MKKSVCLMISWILGLLYSGYLVYYIATSYFSTGGAIAANAAEGIGMAVGVMMIMPHMILTILATIFNVIGWGTNRRGFALTSAILYAIAMVAFFPYFFFVIIQMVLSFVGFATMKKSYH